MITLIKRKDILEQYKIATSLLVSFQKDTFDDNPEYFEENDDRNWYYETNDAVHIDFPKPKMLHSVIAFNHSDLSTYTKALSEKLNLLLTRLHIENVVMIGSHKQSLCGVPDHTYKPYRNAISSFLVITNDIQYEEAIVLELADLPKLLDIAFWFNRCGGKTPEYIYFCDTNEKLCFSICRYGNIHICEYHNEVVTDELLEGLDMHFDDGRCQDQFR
ncbi:hypothetical protein [Pedobacter frigoris]|uniref:hypothetical protein n=1 Tax=Pedobacter frigoris TaxID=2571272 RepID=UPI00292CBB62|nr:hypothetical protein [Pedobacter frigoris]